MPPPMARINLRYSRDLSKPNTFYLLDDGFTMRANIQDAASACCVVELPLRYRRAHAGALHIRPMDSELSSWLVEGSVVHPDLARMELMLLGVPSLVSGSLKTL